MESRTPLTEQHLWELGFIKDGFMGYELRIGQFQPDDRILTFCGDYLYLRQKNDDNRMNDSIITIWNKDLMYHFYFEPLKQLIESISPKQFNPSTNGK